LPPLLSSIYSPSAAALDLRVYGGNPPASHLEQIVTGLAYAADIDRTAQTFYFLCRLLFLTITSNISVLRTIEI
jgi:hypothetical protein